MGSHRPAIPSRLGRGADGSDSLRSPSYRGDVRAAAVDWAGGNLKDSQGADEQIGPISRVQRASPVIQRKSMTASLPRQRCCGCPVDSARKRSKRRAATGGFSRTLPAAR
jgi:hypothetical protein